MFVAHHRAPRVQTCLCPAGADLRSVCPSAASRRTHLSSSSAGWRSQPAAAQLLRQWDRRRGWRWSCSLLLLPPSGLGSPAPAAQSVCTARKKRPGCSRWKKKEKREEKKSPPWRARSSACCSAAGSPPPGCAASPGASQSHSAEPPPPAGAAVSH